MKFTALAALLSVAGARSSIQTASFDECKSHADCGMFFNEHMVCATVTGNLHNFRKNKQMLNIKHTTCTLHAFCKAHDRNIADGHMWSKTVKCMPNAPKLPTVSL